MSARFEFAFSCSPGAIRPDKLQRIVQASVPFPVMERANQDCNQNKKARSKAQPTDSRQGRAPICNSAAAQGLQRGFETAEG